MRDTLNNITTEELCSLLGVSNPKTISSTEGFPNAFFDGNKLLYKKEDVLKFFNIDNIDEPFMTAKEAAEYIGISSNTLTTYAFYDKIPSYRLKVTKGSGYLFRKSELDEFKKITIEGNTEFINKAVGNKLIKDIFSIYINSIKDKLTQQELHVVYSCVFDNISLNKISQDSNISLHRINRTFNKSIQRIKKVTEVLCSIDVLNLKKEILHKDIEIKYLKSQLINGVLPKKDFGNESLIKSVSDVLNIDLLYESLSVRAVNVLRKHDIFTVYNLLMNYNTYNGQISKLQYFRDMGSKSYHEIRAYIIEKQNVFEQNIGINSKDFFTKKPQSEDDIVLFSKIHEYISLFREKKIN